MNLIHKVTFPMIPDPRGCLSFAEKLPFDIKRCYWIYAIQQDAMRGGHAHKNLERIFIAISGSFFLNGHGLNRPWEGLYIPAMTWVELTHFSQDAVCLVLASQEYDPEDYIRSREEYELQSR